MQKKILALFLTIILTLSLVACSTTATTSSAEGPNPIVIQGAMDVETQTLIEALEDAEEITYGGWNFWKGTINDYPVVVSKTEVGMTNAAASTVLAIEKFNPIAIINQGTSGGHDPALHRGDIVLGEKSVNIGSFKSDHSDLGEGIHAENWIARETDVRVNGEVKSFKDFEGDAELLKVAQSLKDTYKEGEVVTGVIGSADQWNRELDRIKWLNENYGSSTEEMETASVAQVAKNYNIPCLGIRILSNSEPNNEDFEPNTGIDCQNFVLDVTKALIEQYTSEAK